MLSRFAEAARVEKITDSYIWKERCEQLESEKAELDEKLREEATALQVSHAEQKNQRSHMEILERINNLRTKESFPQTSELLPNLDMPEISAPLKPPSKVIIFFYLKFPLSDIEKATV